MEWSGWYPLTIDELDMLRPERFIFHPPDKTGYSTWERNELWSLGGVYDIRLAEQSLLYPKGTSSTIYIGSCARKKGEGVLRRVMDHIRVESTANRIVWAFQHNGTRLQFRFIRWNRNAEKEIRAYERKTIAAFNQQYGCAPYGNTQE